MHHEQEEIGVAAQEIGTESKVWSAPTLTVAVLADITESNTGGTYTDGSSNFATS